MTPVTTVIWFSVDQGELVYYIANPAMRTLFQSPNVSCGATDGSPTKERATKSTNSAPWTTFEQAREYEQTYSQFLQYKGDLMDRGLDNETATKKAREKLDLELHDTLAFVDRLHH